MPETSFFLPLFLQSAVLPLAVALAVLAAGRAAGRDAALPAIAAGFLAAYFAILRAQWSVVPQAALDWLPWVVLAAAAAAAAVEKIPGGFARFAGRLATALVAGAVVVYPGLASFGAAKAVASVLVIGFAIAALWSLKARPALGAATRPLLLAVAAGGAGLALMLDSSQSIGQLSGALAMTLAACVLFALPRLGRNFTRAAAGLAVLVFGILLAMAHLYAGFPPGYVALLAAALLLDPVVAAVRRSPSGGLPWVPAAVLTAIPVAVTVALAVKAAHDSGGY